MRAAATRTVYFVVADGIDDPRRVSGGNVYNRHLRDGLRGAGWQVRMVAVPEGSGLLGASELAELPGGALVIIDGLVAVRESVALAAQSSRLRMIALAHMVVSHPAASTGHETDLVQGEALALASVDRVIATSGWTRAELIARALVRPGDVVTAHPGTDPAPATEASRGGGRLLCVGVVAPHKGQDVLIRALARLTQAGDWSCVCAGSLEMAPDFVIGLERTVQIEQLTTRVSFAGTLSGPALDAAYGRADLVVAPSRTESFGMVVTEALARGIPVVASRVGGIPEALSPSGAGILVTPDDPAALETVLREWSANATLRTELTTAARAARATVRSWGSTLAIVEAVLHDVARKEPGEGA